MATGKGHDSYLQIGREATWGTDVAATRRFNVLSCDFQPVAGKVRSDVLTDQRTRPAIYAGPSLARASFELEAEFEGQLHIWDAAFGTATFGSDGATVSGTNPYTRTYILRELINSYTLEAITNIPSGKCDQIVGAKLNRLRFSGTPGLEAPPCKLVTEWIGKAYSNNVTPTAGLSPNSPLPIMAGHVSTGTVDVGTADAAGTERLKSWEFTLDNKLVERYYGAATIDEPLTDEYAEQTVKWSMEFTTKTAIDEYLAHTQGTLLLNFTSGTKQFQLQINKGYIVTPVGRPIDRWGILKQEFTVEPIHDSVSVSGIAAVFINAEATIS